MNIFCRSGLLSSELLILPPAIGIFSGAIGRSAAVCSVDRTPTTAKSMTCRISWTGCERPLRFLGTWSIVVTLFCTLMDSLRIWDELLISS